jgi:iron(II)-dependent oxidoreductase
VYDLSGNVAEWTQDDLLPYDGAKATSDLYTSAPGAAGQPAQNRYYKVLRGGSWKGDPFSTSLYHRDYAFANHATDFYGFRCASSVEVATK